MNTTADSFTGDIIAFLNAAGGATLRGLLKTHGTDGLSTSEFLKKGMLFAMAPNMVNAPPLIQQVVGRAMMRHVDWDAVAEWASVNPEVN
jgi:hypothetical protein